MFVNPILLTANPFIEAYTQSDILGKLIFIGLYVLSICSWIVLLHKLWVTQRIKRNAIRFQEAFLLHKLNPLNLDCDMISSKQAVNPFLELYKTLKKHSTDLLNKNHHFSQLKPGAGPTSQPVSYLSLSDIDVVAAHLSSKVAYAIKDLEQNLYILSTTVSLAPFLGLLGTVWGILTTFSEMQNHSGGGATHQVILGGLSLALATTVLGLIDAIPALIGYNYLKNSIRNFATDMDGFSNEILAAVELQYRKVEP